MKRLVFWLVAVAILLSSVAGLAADAGVVVIGSKEQGGIEAASLDNMQVNVKADIPGYASLLPLSIGFQDRLYCYIEGSNELFYDDIDRVFYVTDEYNRKKQFHNSGAEAEFLIIRLDIINLSKNDVKYSDEAVSSVKAVFDDNYEFKGFVNQYNYNNRLKPDYYTLKADSKIMEGYEWMREGSKYAIINSKDEFPISPMYTGHYAIGCTLPNPVVSSKAPLRVEVQIGEHTLTFHIRK